MEIKLKSAMIVCGLTVLLSTVASHSSVLTLHAESYSGNAALLICRYQGTEQLSGFHMYRDGSEVGVALRKCNRTWDVTNGRNYTVKCPSDNILHWIVHNVTDLSEGIAWQCSASTSNNSYISRTIKLEHQLNKKDIGRMTVYIILWSVVGSVFVSSLTAIAVNVYRKCGLLQYQLWKTEQAKSEETEYTEMPLATLPPRRNVIRPSQQEDIYDDTAVEIDIYNFIRNSSIM